MKHFRVLSRESARYDRKTLKLRCYQERQATLDKIAREICSGRHAVEQFAHNAEAEVPSKVSFAFFGRCSIRHNAGHPPCPTKKFIRAFARIVPTIAIDEFRTSSRCCHCHAKLQSVHGIIADIYSDEEEGAEMRAAEKPRLHGHRVYRLLALSGDDERGGS